jgi:hypothetical protein
MVMVLLFLGVIFLLLGWQALGSSGNSDDDSASVSSVSSSAGGASASPATNGGTSGKPAPANQSDVRIYNITSKEGIAGKARDQLTAAGFKVTETGNLSVSDISTTTVYYSDAEGEKDTANAIGQKLGAPVEPRIDALKGQPPGVIVLVAG